MKRISSTAALFAAALLGTACGGDEDSSGSGSEGASGGSDSGSGGGSSSASGGSSDDGDSAVAFSVTATGTERELPLLTGSFIFGGDDGALRFNLNMTGTAGSLAFGLKREGDEPWVPGSYTPELLTATWFDEEITCAFGEGNADGRELTIELTQIEPAIGSFSGEARCTNQEGTETFTATLSGTFDAT